MPDPILPDFNEPRWDLELSAAVLDASRRADGRAPINTQTGATYTLDLTDEGLMLHMSNAGTNDVFVPPSSSVPFPVSATVLIRQVGTGTTRVRQGSGVTVSSWNRVAPYSLAGQWASAVLTKIGSDQWVLDGNLTA